MLSYCLKCRENKEKKNEVKNKFEVLISKALLDSNIDKEELSNLLKDLI